MDEEKTPTTPEWRKFEKLVARIERAAAPRNATVKSPDRIADISTGTLREVDASIRFTVGTVPVLITIECRKHNKPQDVTWIEQLAMKGQNIGAAQTIAVASEGFTQEAEEMARLRGIVLRKIENVTHADLDSWLAPQYVIHLFRRSHPLSNPGIKFYPNEDDKRDRAKPPEAKSQNLDEAIFVTSKGESISFNDIWLRLQDQHDFYEEIPRLKTEGAPEGKGLPISGAKIQKRIIIPVEKSDLQIETTLGLRDVAEIILHMELWYEEEQVPANRSDYIRYTGPGDVEIQRSESSFTLGNLHMTMALQGGQDGEDATVEAAIRFNKPHRD